MFLLLNLFIDEHQSTADILNIDVKIDPEEMEKLVKIAENYQNSNDFLISVRPWTLGDARKPAIHLISQFALFKCMHGNCTFATDTEGKWIEHMNKHVQMIDALFDSKKFTKSMRNEMIKFRECCYCDYKSKSNSEVKRHMKEQHSRSIFQCAHCFYRSNETDSMVLHYETYHPDSTKEILLCGDKREFETKDREIIEQGCTQYVTKIKCGHGK